MLSSAITSGQRGSIAVEFVTVIPLFAALMLLAQFAFGTYGSSIDNRTVVRQCGWEMASSKCDRKPADCQVSGPIPEPPAVGKIASSFNPILSTFTILRPTLQGPFGFGFSVKRTARLATPRLLGIGQLTGTSRYTSACDEKALIPLTSETVFLATCNQIGELCL